MLQICDPVISPPPRVCGLPIPYCPAQQWGRPLAHPLTPSLVVPPLLSPPPPNDALLCCRVTLRASGGAVSFLPSNRVSSCLDNISSWMSPLSSAGWTPLTVARVLVLGCVPSIGRNCVPLHTKIFSCETIDLGVEIKSRHGCRRSIGRARA